MNKYIIKIDEDNNITMVAYTFDYSAADIELSEEEYHNSLKYKKFDPKTRVFSDLREDDEQKIKETEHEQVTKATYKAASISAEDNTVNMDLIIGLDSKINIIMEHLGLC